MKKMLLLSLLSVALSCPVYATNVDNQKADIQQKFDAKKDKENQDYDKRVADTKKDYQNNPDQLNDKLKRLEIDHNRTMHDLNNDENMKLQKLDENNR